jgi:hypothetical protein
MVKHISAMERVFRRPTGTGETRIEPGMIPRVTESNRLNGFVKKASIIFLASSISAPRIERSQNIRPWASTHTSGQALCTSKQNHPAKKIAAAHHRKHPTMQRAFLSRQKSARGALIFGCIPDGRDRTTHRPARCLISVTALRPTPYEK